MAWTPEHRRRYAPAITEAVRANAILRLAATVDVIGPPARTGRPRLWSTLVMLQALWWLCRAGAAWKLLPAAYPPRQTIGSRLERWVRLEALERALAVLNGCLRLARGRKWRPSAGILDTQSVRTGPRRGPRGAAPAATMPPRRSEVGSACCSSPVPRA
jgi:putative transposase